jgi:cyanophycinase
MSYPKGILIAIGGAEDKGIDENIRTPNTLNFKEQGILRTIVEVASKKSKPIIEVITTASSIPDEVGRTYKQAFKKLGCSEVGHLKILEREQAESKKNMERLERCNCIMFSGGDQLKLCSILGGTTFLTLLKQRFEDEYFVIAGTSAGAAAMSSTMIFGGPEEKAYLKGEVHVSMGFGFMQNVIIDTHFDARGRFGRLAQAIATQPGQLGIGLDEDTGVIIEKGLRLKAIGSSSVVIIDGSNVKHNYIADLKSGQPISVADLKVHILSNSAVYDIETHEFKNSSAKTNQRSSV